MAVSAVLLPAILVSCLLVLSESNPSVTQIGPERNQQNHELIRELEELKIKMARLESRLDETVKDLNAKSLYLKESDKLIEQMANKMDHLQSTLSSLEDESFHARLNQLEEEVRDLWATLRKSNFELHLLESKVQDTEDKLELVTSQIETTAAIVTEQWIQIQKLEQALHMAETRVLTVKWLLSSTKCTFLKSIRHVYGNHLRNLMGMLDSFLFNKGSAFGSYMSHAFRQLDRISSAARKYHHKLQGFVKQEMERNEFTAALANKEVVFLVASALVIFPIMGAWMLISSQCC